MLPTHRKARLRHKSRWQGAKVDSTEIGTTSLSKEASKGRRTGFCVDIGAPRSFVGMKEAIRIFSCIGGHLKLVPPSRRCRFADSLYESIRVVMIPLKTPPGIPIIKASLDVILADVRALLGMDDNHSLTPRRVSNRQIRRTVVDHRDPSHSYIINDCSVPLIRHEGHL